MVSILIIAGGGGCGGVGVCGAGGVWVGCGCVWRGNRGAVFCDAESGIRNSQNCAFGFTGVHICAQGIRGGIPAIPRKTPEMDVRNPPK